MTLASTRHEEHLANTAGLLLDAARRAVAEELAKAAPGRPLDALALEATAASIALDRVLRQSVKRFEARPEAVLIPAQALAQAVAEVLDQEGVTEARRELGLHGFAVQVRRVLSLRQDQRSRRHAN